MSKGENMVDRHYAHMGKAQLRPVPLKFAPPIGGFGDPEPAIYSHSANLDQTALSQPNDEGEGK
jgi:hypothetical protein